MPSNRYWPTLRRSQTLSPFGIGMVVDISGESFVIADQGFWGTEGEPLRLQRLEKALGVSTFRTATAKPEHDHSITNAVPGVPAVRFPRWNFCPRCRGMVLLLPSDEHQLEPQVMIGGAPVDKPASQHRCREDSCRVDPPALVPMRFVTVCANGHLDDVDWPGWAHSSPSRQPCGDRRLRFEQRGVGGGLEALYVSCDTCGAERSLGDISGGGSTRRESRGRGATWRPYQAQDPAGEGGGCRGRQPWQTETFSSKRCRAIPEVVARGGSNVTFLATESALDIPPGSNHVVEDPHSIETRIRSHANYDFLVQLLREGAERELPLVTRKITAIVLKSSDPAITADLVWQVAAEEAGLIDAPAPAVKPLPPEDTDPRPGEFAAFLGDSPPYHPKNRFQVEHVDIASWGNTQSGQALAELVSHVIKATVLREVRVQRGFSRLQPVRPHDGNSPPQDVGTARDGSADPQHSAGADDGQKNAHVFVPAGPPGLGWLPAIEVLGEGVFFTLDPRAVAKWKAGSQWVTRRIAGLKARIEENLNAARDSKATPEFVLLHTLSHLVCLQLAFTCGYSLASLRERIYCGTAPDGSPMHGILIYTAAGDTEGALGGLARQADPDRFLDTLIGAITEARWCSSDPLCIEAGGQGRDGLNLAACHGCALLPETSCEEFNLLLDRALLIGDLEGMNHRGFFGGLVAAVDESDPTT